MYTDGHIDRREKADGSPVTQADMTAHNILTRRLSELTPDIPVLSEEDVTPFQRRREWTQCWIVDPLDGTRSFLRHSPEFAVCIGLVQTGSPVMGLIDLPAYGRTYIGVVGRGAWCREENGGLRPLVIPDSPQGTLTVAVSRSFRGEEKRWLATHGLGSARMLARNSAWKFCLVTEQAAHVYLRTGPSMEWDVCAGHALVLAAGGSMATLEGTRPTYNKADLHAPPFWAGWAGWLGKAVP